MNDRNTMIQQQQKVYDGGSRINGTTSSNDAHHSTLRPYDTLGPPSDPIEFPRPQLVRGRRDTVLCYNPVTDEHEVLENVLFRDCLVGRYGNNNSSSNASSPSARRGKGSNGNRNNNNNNNNQTNNDPITQAFWPIPYKAKIQTIMGHVEYVQFCLLIMFVIILCF